MKFRIDFLHCALIAIVVLLAVHIFGPFREGVRPWYRRSGGGAWSQSQSAERQNDCWDKKVYPTQADGAACLAAAAKA